MTWGFYVQKNKEIKEIVLLKKWALVLVSWWKVVTIFPNVCTVPIAYTVSCLNLHTHYALGGDMWGTTLTTQSIDTFDYTVCTVTNSLITLSWFICVCWACWSLTLCVSCYHPSDLARHSERVIIGFMSHQGSLCPLVMSRQAIVCKWRSNVVPCDWLCCVFLPNQNVPALVCGLHC